jgi:hypothetical protein
MAIVVKLPDDGEYLTELSSDENGSTWLTWSRTRKAAIRFDSRKDAIRRIDEHLGRRVEIIRGDAKFIHLVPRKRHGNAKP